jgi:magnesium transporter
MIDIVVDNYFNVGDRIEMRIDKLEEDILVHTKKSQLEEIIGLRGEILWLRKMLGPQRQLIATLNNKELRLIDNELQKYFSDVYENQVKINDSFDTYRDLMGNLRDSYQSSLSARANDIMRIFTALTTIFMPLTFLTGVYGMNFVYLPFAESHWGAIIFIGIMVVLGLGMLYLFKKKDWL